MQPVFAKFDHGKNAAEAGLEAEPVVRNMQYLLERLWFSLLAFTNDIIGVYK